MTTPHLRERVDGQTILDSERAAELAEVRGVDELVVEGWIVELVAEVQVAEVQVAEVLDVVVLTDEQWTADL